MYSKWADAAQDRIAEVASTLSNDASLTDRRRALRAAAGGFHGGTSWGKKVWSRECRKHLELHGLPAREVEDARQPRLIAALERGDIEFPFRGQS